MANTSGATNKPYNTCKSRTELVLYTRFPIRGIYLSACYGSCKSELHYRLLRLRQIFFFFADHELFTFRTLADNRALATFLLWNSNAVWCPAVSELLKLCEVSFPRAICLGLFGVWRELALRQTGGISIKKFVSGWDISALGDGGIFFCD